MTSEAIEKIVAGHDGEQGMLISILEAIQARYNYLPEEALRIVSLKTGLSLVDIYGVATFYKAFSLTPRGKHRISVCLGTACHVRSAPAIVDEFNRHLGLKPGETSDDGEFTLETVNCLGTCALGPIVECGGQFFSMVERKDVKKIIRDVRSGKGSLSTGGNGRREEGEDLLRVLCPQCNGGLMDGKDDAGVPSIVLDALVNGSRSKVRLSNLLGPLKRRSEGEIPQDAVVRFSCPTCSEVMTDNLLCPECGSPMVSFAFEGGGMLFICSRWKCNKSEVRLTGSRNHTVSVND